jgi:hypothetical protein
MWQIIWRRRVKTCCNRRKIEKKKQPENRIFQRKFILINRPFIASVK